MEKATPRRRRWRPCAAGARAESRADAAEAAAAGLAERRGGRSGAQEEVQLRGAEAEAAPPPRPSWRAEAATAAGKATSKSSAARKLAAAEAN